MLVFTSPPDNFNSTMNTVGFFGIYQNKLLHLRRQDHKSDGNKRAGPGGKIDSTDDNPEQAMIRELREETGIKLDKIEFIKTYYVRYPDRDFIYHKFKYTFTEKPEVKIKTDEHKGFDWFTPQEALEHELLLGEDEVIKDIYDI